MKRLLAYALILALVWVIPVERLDVAQLRPVEVIAVYKENGQVKLATDTEDMGIGADAASALENMRQTSPAVIYLDTAEYLLIAPGAEEEAEFLRSQLKDSVKLCGAFPSVNIKEAAKYLPVHGNLPRMKQWQPGVALPILTEENGRMKMLKNNEKTP